STRACAARSTSSTGARCCAPGSTTRRRVRAISTICSRRTRRAGARSEDRCCSTRPTAPEPRASRGEPMSRSSRPHPNAPSVLRAALAVALVVVGGGMSARAAAHATQDEPRAEDQLTPVLARVLATPAVVVQSDGVWRLPWELVLTNVTDVPITIESVEVLDPTRGDAVVTKLDGENLASRIGPPVRSTTLGPGQDTVMYLEASFPRREDVPKKLAHRIVATTKQPKPPLGERTVERVAPTDVITDAPLVVGPPLRGARWVAAASCCDSYHRRAV